VHILLILALILIIYWYLKSDWARTPLEHRRQWLTQKFGFALIALLILLAVTGRLHWIGALVGSVIPAIKMIYDTFKRKPIEDSKDEPKRNPSSDKMSRDEALQILGFNSGESPSEDEIKEAHKSLMQKCHPDRGGNTFLAAQLNNAKDRLLNN